jgi:transcriptional regulator GlxA family with amidase domain
VKRRSVREILDHREWAEVAAEVEYDAVALAMLCGVSLRTLERAFQKELQISPQEWLEKLRDAKAALLVNAGKRKKEIVYMLGYKYQSHLSRRLKQAQQL